MKIVDAIKQAQLSHVNGGAAINQLRTACFDLIAAVNAGSFSGISPEINAVQAALLAVPEHRVDWDYHGALRDAGTHAGKMDHYPDLMMIASELRNALVVSLAQIDSQTVPAAVTNTITRADDLFAKITATPQYGKFE